MKGHTNKSTINARRPLTDNMKRVLVTMIRIGQMYHSDLDQSEANAIKALCDRGYATWDITTRSYSATDVGRLALAPADG
jgi:hypothetical protein